MHEQKCNPITTPSITKATTRNTIIISTTHHIITCFFKILFNFIAISKIGVGNGFSFPYPFSSWVSRRQWSSLIIVSWADGDALVEFNTLNGELFDVSMFIFFRTVVNVIPKKVHRVILVNRAFVIISSWILAILAGRMLEHLASLTITIRRKKWIKFVRHTENIM